MGTASSDDLLAILIVVGGLVGSTLFALFVARRARASRRRQLAEVDERRSVDKVKPRLIEEFGPDDDGEDEPAAAPSAGAAAETEGPADRPASPPVAHPPPEPESAKRPQATPAETATAPAPALVPRPSATAVPIDRPRVVSRPPAVFTPGPPAARGDGATADAGRAALKRGLERTRSSWVKKLGGLFSARKQIDPGFVDEIERVLLTADIGVRTTTMLLEDIRTSLSKKELTDGDAVWNFLRSRTSRILDIAAPPFDTTRARPFVLLVIGVNGTGKTTTIGKLSARLRSQGRSVLLAAGDTFRAAAVEQLEVWASRTNSPIVRGKEGADPSSVIFDAVKRAQADGVDVVIADTAGRLHTKSDLMDELQKVRRVLGKAMDGAPHETWLVLDATSGQNAIAQAQIFTQAMQVTGLVLTKLDGTAKGGVVLGIADQLKIPVRFIGVGEAVDDLRPFVADEFVAALYEDGDGGAS